jgi:hypothetical protein
MLRSGSNRKTRKRERLMKEFSIVLPEGKNNIKIDIKVTDWGMWTGFIWLRIGISGGLL